MSCKDSDNTIMITVMCWPKCMIFGVETLLGGEVMSTFVFLLINIARVLTSIFVVTTALRKGPWRCWPNCHECFRALTLRCRNSPWCQSCECCNNFLSSFGSPLLAQLKGVVLTCRMLIAIEMRCKLYSRLHYKGNPLNEAWIRAGGSKQSGATGKHGNAETEMGTGTETGMGTETGKHGNSLSDRARRCQQVWTTRVQSQGIYRVLERFVWAFICEHVHAIFWTIS